MAEEIVVVGAQKIELLKVDCQCLRKEGIIPAVIYGPKLDSKAIVIQQNDAVKALWVSDTKTRFLL
ncbi:MAG: hypothetical protein R2827_07115 [Bdellovibrionales bacterium]